MKVLVALQFLTLTSLLLTMQSQSLTAQSTDSSKIVRNLTENEARILSAILIDCELKEFEIVHLIIADSINTAMIDMLNGIIDQKSRIITECERSFLSLEVLALEENVQKNTCLERLEKSERKNKRRGITIFGLSGLNLLWLLLLL